MVVIVNRIAMKHIFIFGLLVNLVGLNLANAEQQTVSLNITTCDGREQQLHATTPVYLSDFLVHLDWQACNYPYGALLSFPERKAAQSALQTKLLSFLTNPARLASLTDEQRDYFQKVAQLISEQPVTGRRPLALIDPKAIEVTPNTNPVIRNQAYLQLMNRPDFIRLLGFETVVMRHVTAQTLSEYLASTQLLPGLVPGYVWVVQANGQIEKLRYGLWTFNSPAVSPGAWLIAEVPSSWIKDYPQFNEELAQWLATQAPQ